MAAIRDAGQVTLALWDAYIATPYESDQEILTECLNLVNGITFSVVPELKACRYQQAGTGGEFAIPPMCDMDGVLCPENGACDTVAKLTAGLS